MRVAIRSYSYYNDVVIFHRFVDNGTDGINVLYESISGSLNQCFYGQIRFVSFDEVIELVNEQLANESIVEQDRNDIINKLSLLKDGGHIH